MPKRVFDKILVIDLELTCYENNQFPLGEFQEIIEIGICELEIQTGKLLRNNSILIRPWRSRVSEYCTNLTGLTYERLRREGAYNFSQAISRFVKEYGPKKRVWAAWGNADKWAIERDCQYWNVKYPFGPTYYNVKDLYSIKHKLSKGLGCEKAMNRSNLPKEGEAHRGYVDARWTAIILRDILWNT